MLMASRWATSTRRAYVNWLTLASHEHFHAWNVKRLRPVELGPFDYERENPTTSLWIAEGFTAYYEHLMVRRAGLTTDAEMIDGITSDIRDLQTTPGRLTQPVETASLDAWIKYYRSDENTPNTAISYYTKGAVIAFVLDAQDPQGHQRREEPRRRDAARLQPLRRRQGLHRGRVQGRRARSRRARLRRVVDVGAADDRGAELRRGARVARPALQAGRSGTRRGSGQGVARRDDEERRRPPGRDAGEARHAGAPGRRQRRRRDPGHRRLPRPRRRAGSTAGAVRRRAAR